MSNLERQTLQIVEIDLDACSLTYGQGSCPGAEAAGLECFNTFSTCDNADTRAVFDKTTKTYRFSKNQKTGIFGQVVFPALQSVSTSAARISLGQTQQNSADALGSLGKRSRVTIKLKDFATSDRFEDPYVDGRSYDPVERGTFFGKLRARNPYYYGRALRVRNGYVGDAISAMPVRNYIITSWVGPDSSGNVTITAQDPLKLADEEFSLCPAPSNGRLGLDISDTYTGNVAFSAAGAGDDYTSTGRICIGNEVMTYSITDSDTINILSRGADGTEAASHSAGDTVQECFRVENAKAYTVAEYLMTMFADLNPDYITSEEWEAEIDRWFPSLLLTRTVPKPMSVASLLSEIANFGIVFWWDEVDQKIRVKANRPAAFSETFAELTDESDILEKTAKREDLEEQRISRALVWHGYIDPTQDMKSGDNYSRPLPAAIDVSAEGPNEYDQSRLIQVFLPWLGPEGNLVLAETIAVRLVNRYRNTPQRLTFHLDIKDRDQATLADLVKVTSRTLQDEFGSGLATEMQITSVEEIDPGMTLRIVAETYQFTGRFGFITENSQADYGASTAADREKLVFIGDETAPNDPLGDGSSFYVMF